MHQADSGVRGGSLEEEGLGGEPWDDGVHTAGRRVAEGPGRPPSKEGLAGDTGALEPEPEPGLGSGRAMGVGWIGVEFHPLTTRRGV